MQPWTGSACISSTLRRDDGKDHAVCIVDTGIRSQSGGRDPGGHALPKGLTNTCMPGAPALPIKCKYMCVMLVEGSARADHS
mmetsp:Transcript_15476/g.33579  ORF Transcript_15476/g.33579 Transcript_15476/m.33579 type:complete len:82 (-) Transcript_15476:912-1157(-)